MIRFVEVERIVVVGAAAALELSTVAVTVFWWVVNAVEVCVVAGDEGAARDEAGVATACVDWLGLEAGDAGPVVAGPAWLGP